MREQDKNQRKKILVISHQLSRTGAPIVLLDLIQIYWKRGYQIEVITMLDGELREELDKMQITVTVQEHFLEQAEDFFQLIENFDLVVLNTLITFEAVHLLKYARIPVVWWIHEGKQYFEYFQTVLPDFRKLPANIHVFSVSHSVQQMLAQIYGVSTEILHFGIKDEYTDHRKNTGNKVRFLTAGMYSKVKAQDVLVEAIRKLPKEYLQRAEFFFCGNEQMYDESVFFAVKRLSEEYENVTLLHQLSRKETLEWMEQCDCLVVPSRSDTVSAVAVEMMMKRNLCLCTEACGVSYYIQDGVNGFIVPTEDVRALAEKIIYIIENNSCLDDVRVAGREIFELYFSEKVFEPKVLALAEKYIEKEIKDV